MDSGRSGGIIRHAHSIPAHPVDASYYPGRRRRISPDDALGQFYILPILRMLAPLIGQAFGARNFTVQDASYSIITLKPEELSPLQRVPDCDGVDDKRLAIPHYLTPTQGTGFFRHRARGIERSHPAMSTAIWPAFARSNTLRAILTRIPNIMK